ncbi:hypothetical protein Emed_005029 [Eimeria media]
MDYRSLRPSARSEVQPLQGDLGAPPVSSSGTTAAAARSGENKMERPSRSCYGVSDEKPLTHPQKWAMTLLASRTSLGNALLPLAVRLPSSAIDENEWLACQVYDIFNESAVVWGFIDCRRVSELSACAAAAAASDSRLPPCVARFREPCRIRAGISPSMLRTRCFSLVAPAEPSAPAREHIKKALAKCRAILQDGRIFVTQQASLAYSNLSPSPTTNNDDRRSSSSSSCSSSSSSCSSSSSSCSSSSGGASGLHALYFGSEFRLVKLEDVAPIKASKSTAGGPLYKGPLYGLALHFLEQAQRDIAEAEASEGKQHPANAKHKQQQQQQQQQPQLQQQQHQAQQDKR